MLPVSAAVVAFVNTALQLIVSFGLDLTTYQQAAITTTVNSFVLLVLSLSHAYRAHLADSERWSHLNGGTE